MCFLVVYFIYAKVLVVVTTVIVYSMSFLDYDHLDLKDLNDVIRHEAGVATRWYDLGVELLDSNTAVLDVIQSDHQSSHDRCSQMFKTWLKMKSDANWCQLVTALNKIGLKTVADNIHRNTIPSKGMMQVTGCLYVCRALNS